MGHGDSFLLTAAFIAVIVSVAGAGFTYVTVNDFNDWITGFAAQENATVEIQVVTSASVNFTTNLINWSNGTFNAGAAQANLSTVGSGSVIGGTWVAQTGLILENDGNTNVTLDLSTTKDNSTFLGGSDPIYQFNVTNLEAHSCLNATGEQGNGTVLSRFNNVNITFPGTRVCNVFQFLDTNDTVRVDIFIAFSTDVPNKDASQQDTVMATVAAV